MQVARSPEAPAVACVPDQLTYRELNALANRLAHRLRKLAVGSDVLVGICMGPSVEMMVGLLGILKAGAAYVPLDPAYPRERLAFIVEDTAMQIVVTQESLRSVVPPGPKLVLLNDARSEEIENDAQSNPDVAISPENLAYVIYTSGSTGRPKGVMIPHRGLTNYLVWASEAYQVATGTGAPVHSSISFDLTITALFTPLLVGRCVHILATGGDLQALGRALQRNEDFSLIKITPAHLELLSRQLSPDKNAGRIGAFIVGGEALLGENLRFWQDHAPDSILVNEYGPTETVVGCCVYFVPRGARFDGPVPIGRPIANTQLYVLDKDRRPVQPGAKGELYIGGDGVARGYLNRPDLTAESFVPNPFAEAGNPASPQLYKTGDLVRALPDGNLEFLGRIDDQVKIRGYRIEPGEIEVALATNPLVKGAAVLPHGDPGPHLTLRAYVVGPEPRVSSARELRRFLKQKLPDYMVPAAFVLLRGFPITPNGKVDRQALKSAVTKLMCDDSPAEPRTQSERRMSEVWRDVLQQETVGIHDDFFDLGGHSLLAVRLVAEINRVFQANLDVLALYERPTIAELATDFLMEPAFPGLCRSVKTNLSENEFQRVLTLRNQGSRPPLFALYNLSGDIEDYIDLTQALGEDQPVFGIRCPGIRYHFRLPLSMEIAASEVVSCIRKVQRTGAPALLGYSWAGWLAFEVAHQLHQQEGVCCFTAMVGPDAPMRPTNCISRLTHLIRYSPWWCWRRMSRRNQQSQGEGKSAPDEVLSKTAGRFVKILGQYRPPLESGFPVDLFRESEFSPNPPHPKRAWDTSYLPDGGWSRWELKEFRTHWVQGNHRSVIKPPLVFKLAESIRQAMDHHYRAS